MSQKHRNNQQNNIHTRFFFPFNQLTLQPFSLWNAIKLQVASCFHPTSCNLPRFPPVFPSRARRAPRHGGSDDQLPPSALAAAGRGLRLTRRTTALCRSLGARRSEKHDGKTRGKRGGGLLRTGETNLGEVATLMMMMMMMMMMMKYMKVFERFVLEGKVGVWEFWEGTLRDFLKRECLWYDVGTWSNICEKANGEDYVEHGLIRDIKSNMPQQHRLWYQASASHDKSVFSKISFSRIPDWLEVQRKESLKAQPFLLNIFITNQCPSFEHEIHTPGTSFHLALRPKRPIKRLLLRGSMGCFFRLIEQFHTQGEPAYCGLGTVAMVLNALGRADFFRGAGSGEVRKKAKMIFRPFRDKRPFILWNTNPPSFFFQFFFVKWRQG